MGPFEMTNDGAALIYVGPSESAAGSQLWVKSWGEIDARPISGTEGARRNLTGGRLAVAPDGREVAFALGNPGPPPYGSVGGRSEPDARGERVQRGVVSGRVDLLHVGRDRRH